MTDRIKSLIGNRGNIVAYDSSKMVLMVIGRMVYASNLEDPHAIHSGLFSYSILHCDIEDGDAMVLTADGFVYNE